MLEIYTEIQNRLISEYGITICDGVDPYSKEKNMCNYCKCKTHRCAYFDGENFKRVRNWKQENTVFSTYVLLHEIGHTLLRYESETEDEYRASVFAIRKCKELHIPLTREIVVKNQHNILNIYRSEASEYNGYDLFGIEKPEWLKTAEYYNVVKVYDEVFEVSMDEVIKNLSK